MQKHDPRAYATAQPLGADEQEATFNRDGGGGTRKRVPRPDADGFSVPVDAGEDPPIASVFDSYGDDE